MPNSAAIIHPVIAHPRPHPAPTIIHQAPLPDDGGEEFRSVDVEHGDGGRQVELSQQGYQDHEGFQLCGQTMWPPESAATLPLGQAGEACPLALPQSPSEGIWTVHPYHLVSWSADSEEGQSATGNKYISWESWSVEWDPCGLSGHHLLCGLSSCIPASRLSVIFHMFTQIQLPPPHRLLLLELPFSPRPAPVCRAACSGLSPLLLHSLPGREG